MISNKSICQLTIQLINGMPCRTNQLMPHDSCLTHHVPIKNVLEIINLKVILFLEKRVTGQLCHMACTIDMTCQMSHMTLIDWSDTTYN
jgi:hypothetical protein